MTTYGVMIDRIEDEILRTDIRSSVEDAIKTSIKHYSDERFWFNEASEDPNFTTVTSSNTYTLSAAYLEIDHMTVEVSSNEYPLIRRTFDWYREVQTNPVTVVGIPTDYAEYEDKLWVYPTPNGAYPVRLYGLKKITELDSVGELTLTDTAVTNDWFTHGEDLIRNRAIGLIYSHKLRSPELAVPYHGYEGTALAKLQRKSRRKTATGVIQPTSW
jgi:hypothetical protein